nr:phosphoribosylformylglycinamidine cyclo-ligase [Eubacterium sp.]
VGGIDEEMMYATYNMGLGMIIAVDEADVDETMKAIEAAGDKAYLVGHVEEGEKEAVLV